MKVNFPILLNGTKAGKCPWFDRGITHSICIFYCCGQIENDCPFKSLNEVIGFSPHGRKLNREGKLKFIKLEIKKAKFLGKILYGHK